MTGLELSARMLSEVAVLIQSEPFVRVGIWTLSLVLVWSAIAKIRRPASAALALVRFGLMRRASPTLGAAAGGLEFGIAALLIIGVFERSIATASLVLAC